MKLNFGLMFLIIVIFSGKVSAQIRQFPDTQDGIYIFHDQLTPNLTESQWDFAASHLVGCQKMTRSDVQKLRTRNPDFIILNYKLALGAGPAEYILGDNWVSDWDYVKTQPWFLTTAEGDTLYQPDWNWYLMDVSGELNGNQGNGWKEYWAEQALIEIDSTDADGVFADSYDFALLNTDPVYPSLIPYDPRFDGPAIMDFFPAHHDTFALYVSSELQSEDVYFLPNLGQLITSWNDKDFTEFSDGGMIEGFAAAGPYSSYAPEDWELQMNRILDYTANGKILLLETYLDMWELQRRLYAIASYLLVKGHQTFYTCLGVGENALEWYPEYDLDLGSYLQEPPDSLKELWDSTWNVYKRDYENGIVLVNPWYNEVTIAELNDTLYSVSFQGGGYVDGAGMASGSLNYTSVTGLTIPGNSAVILVDDIFRDARVEDVQAFHRSGQTFITWTEATDVPGESYAVYRHTSPITSENLADAEQIVTIGEGSGVHVTEEWRGSVGYTVFQTNFIIDDLGEELADSTGLLVYTIQPGEEGSAYYAVTITISGLEDSTLIAGSNSLINPVDESVNTPKPVLVWESDDGLSRVYTQFMDVKNWNITFEGYAYNFGVMIPSDYDQQQNWSMTYDLTGWGGRYWATEYGGSPWGNPTIYVVPDEPRQSWYFGFSEEHQYREVWPYGAENYDYPESGNIVNYAEQRLLRIIDDLQLEEYNIDENRIYVFGHSMGGSGALALGMRYPDVFAATYSSEPKTKYEESVEWVDDASIKWGIPELDLPVLITGDYAVHLAEYNNMSVWDWQNHQLQMQQRLDDEMAYITLAHGDADEVIHWDTQGEPWYPIFADSARRAGSGAVVPGVTHYWLNYEGTGYNWN